MKFLIIICIISFVGTTWACKGYQLRVDSVENCGGDDQIITFNDNATMLLTEDCELTPIFCITTQAFSTAQVKYKINKNGLPFLRGSADMCQRMEKFKDNEKALLDLFGLPHNCPFEEREVCYNADKKADVTKYNNLLPLVRGKLKAEIEITHDTGISCFKLGYEFFNDGGYWRRDGLSIVSRRATISRPSN